MCMAYRGLVASLENPIASLKNKLYVRADRAWQFVHAIYCRSWGRKVHNDK